MAKNQESTTYEEAEAMKYGDNFYAALEGWEPILGKEGKVMGYRTKPLVESMIQVLHGSPELVHQGPQPEAHKSIHDYRDQLAAKRRRKKR